MQRSLEFVSSLRKVLMETGYFFQGVLEEGDSRSWGPCGQARQGAQWRANQKWVGGPIGQARRAKGKGSTASSASLCC